MKHIKLFEGFVDDNEVLYNKIKIKTGEFYKIYLNLYWLCSFFDNADNFPKSKVCILKKHKKFPMDKDLKIDDTNLYYNGFPIPLAKSEDDFTSIDISILNSLQHNDEWDADQVLGGNLSESVYDNRFNAIYNKVYNLDIAINQLYKDIYGSFYKEVLNFKNDDLLKQTTIESREYFISLLKSKRDEGDLGSIIAGAFNDDKPVLLKEIWTLWA
jgi:hypothetical protein